MEFTNEGDIEMRISIATLAITGLLAFSLSACSAEVKVEEGGGDAPAADTEAACAECAKGEAGEAVFCKECKKGYVDGAVATECEGCFAKKAGIEGAPPCPT
jgi:hypothetical protein